jgi:hypothetical protein
MPQVFLSEKLLRLLKKTLSDGHFASITKGGEFLELGFLFLAQSCRDLDLYARVQVAVAVALKVLDSFAFDAEGGPGLGAGRDLDDRFAFERGHFNFRAERGLNETDGDFAVQIVAIALKNFVGRHVQDDV